VATIKQTLGGVLPRVPESPRLRMVRLFHIAPQHLTRRARIAEE